MKKKFLYFFTFFLFSSFSFSEEYEEGLKRASKESKPLIIYFFSPDCPYCELMDREVLSEKKIKALLDTKVIFVRIDAEKRQNIARKYGVFAYPFFSIFDPSGKNIGKIPGYIPQKTFKRILDFLVQKMYEKGSLYDFLMAEEERKSH